MSEPALRLHGYYRSTAAWRVRIALNLKGVGAVQVTHPLRDGAQRAPDYLKLNSQGLVPTLEIGDGAALTQSLAICEWLDETYPFPPLLPDDATQRARVRAFSMAIACDIHPVQNLKVLTKLRDMALSSADVAQWARWIVEGGLSACEALLADTRGPFCFGSMPTIADLCLVPQLYNARRFDADLAGLTRLLAVEAECNALTAFTDAAPGHQADA